MVVMKYRVGSTIFFLSGIKEPEPNEREELEI